MGAAFGLKVLPLAVTWILNRVLGCPNPDLLSSLEGVPIPSYTWRVFLATVAGVYPKRSKARLSVSFDNDRCNESRM